jgi:hypothetical protein
MLIEQIALESIDPGDEAFRISEELDSPPLRDSLKAIGLLNPVLVLERNSRFKIVCGFRRIHAARHLGMSSLPAQILPADRTDPLKAYAIAVRDNASHRTLTPLENARVLYKLSKDFELPRTALIAEYMPLLGLNPAEPLLKSYLMLHQIHHELRQCLKDGRLTLSSIETLAGMPPRVQEGIAALLGKIRLSASMQKKFLALLTDLSIAMGILPDALLGRLEIIGIAEDQSLSPFQKGEKVYDYLYRLRNPRLSLATEQFLLKKKRLRLPGSIRISAHPFFEEPGLHIEFDAPDLARFRALAAALHESAESAESEELFKI